MSPDDWIVDDNWSGIRFDDVKEIRFEAKCMITLTPVQSFLERNSGGAAGTERRRKGRKAIIIVVESLLELRKFPAFFAPSWRSLRLNYADSNESFDLIKEK